MLRKGYSYYVINPITKQWFALPPIPRPRSHGLICKYDYNDDSFSNRVVLLTPKSKLWEFEAHTFSSDTAEWSVMGFSEEFQFAGFPFNSALPYKGLLFWCVLVAVFSRLIHTKAYVVVPLWLRSLKNGSQWCLPMKHGCVSRLGCGCGCGCGTRQFLKKVGAGAAGLGN